MKMARTTMKFLLFFAVLCTGYLVQADDVHKSLEMLRNMIIQDPSKICPFIECQMPVSKEECPTGPNGTIYMEGVAQFGCCGACVRFKQNDDVNCTGSVSKGYNDSSLLDPEQDITESIGNILYSHWCDYGLECDETGVCIRLPDEAPCKVMQEEFDAWMKSGNNILYRDDYRWRPDCTPEGDFVEKQCKGPEGEKRCVCVDPQGNTLYGKAFSDQKDLWEDMNCKCSRKVWERQQAGEVSVPLHCQENGNYEPLQCDNGWCYCLDPLTGIAYEPVFPEAARRKLTCYNESLIGSQYLRRCESQYRAHMILMEVMKAHGTIGPEIALKCDPDGSYSGEQLSTDNLEYCFTKYFEYSEPFVLSGDNCNCARDRWLFQQFGVPFPYTCEANRGSYMDIQKVVNRAFCVDVDGIRSGPLVFQEHADRLNCTMSTECQEGITDSCDKVCMENGKICPPNYYFKYSPTP